MNISARNLTMCFRDAERTVELFSDLNFEIQSGTSVAIVGESGVGKTTLLYLLGGLEDPIGGDVCLGEFSLNEARKRNDELALLRGKYLGFVFQFHQLLPEFDAQENVAIPLLLRGIDSHVAMRQAEELLGRVGLEQRLQHRPGMLSGGEQQRVAIARAFVGRPGVILADEPTGNLDVKTGAAVQQLLLELQKEQKITLVVVTHSLELARTMDRVVELTPTGLKEFK